MLGEPVPLGERVDDAVRVKEAVMLADCDCESVAVELTVPDSLGVTDVVGEAVGDGDCD